MSSDSFPLAVVTGASRRVGRLIALHLAKRGYAIGLHYNTSQTDAENTLKEIADLEVPVFFLQADLANPDEIGSMFQKITEFGIGLKVWVNSAAVMPKSDLMHMQSSEWDALWALNTRAVWLCSREAGKKMSDGGVILNISDVGARKTWTGYGGYVMSKAAVEVLTRLMAKQLAPKIRVCAIAPGLLMRDEKILEDGWEKLILKAPMKKGVESGEFLSTVDFLLDNGYITGETITVASGYQLV